MASRFVFRLGGANMFVMAMRRRNSL